MLKELGQKNIATGDHKVVDINKREDTLKSLYVMAEETDQQSFIRLLDCNIQNLLNDKDTMQFEVYINSYYASRIHQWAACYRINVNININKTVDRWHRELKYNSDLKGKCGGRLDKTIHSSMNSLKMKLMNRLSTLIRRKLTKKLTTLQKSHKAAGTAIHEI